MLGTLVDLFVRFSLGVRPGGGLLVIIAVDMNCLWCCTRSDRTVCSSLSFGPSLHQFAQLGQFKLYGGGSGLCSSSTVLGMSIFGELEEQGVMLDIRELCEEFLSLGFS